MFLDEAYALAGITGSKGSCGSRDSYGNDAIATLLTESENNRTNVMVILAGYQDPMDQLLDADPGLRRRFPNKLALPDYSYAELAAIASKACSDRFDCKLGKGVAMELVGAWEPERGSRLSLTYLFNSYQVAKYERHSSKVKFGNDSTTTA